MSFLRQVAMVSDDATVYCDMKFVPDFGSSYRETRLPILSLDLEKSCETDYLWVGTRMLNIHKHAVTSSLNYIILNSFQL